MLLASMIVSASACGLEPTATGNEYSDTETAGVSLTLIGNSDLVADLLMRPTAKNELIEHYDQSVLFFGEQRQEKRQVNLAFVFPVMSYQDVGLQYLVHSEHFSDYTEVWLPVELLAKSGQIQEITQDLTLKLTEPSASASFAEIGYEAADLLIEQDTLLYGASVFLRDVSTNSNGFVNVELDIIRPGQDDRLSGVRLGLLFKPRQTADDKLELIEARRTILCRPVHQPVPGGCAP